MTGLPNFSLAALQTALMSSPIMAGTQVWYTKTAGGSYFSMISLIALNSRFSPPNTMSVSFMSVVKPVRQRLRAGGFGAAIVPGIALAGDRAVDQMGHVGKRLQRDLGAVEGAAAGGTAGLQLLGAALLAFGLGFVGILAAARLVEDILDGGRQRTHSSLLRNGVTWHAILAY